MIRLVLAVLALLTATAAAQQPARHVDDELAYEIGSQLRCVVCQNLSVADSPSEMAGQMRALIRERLAAGDSRDQVMRYFEDRYSQWVLLAPKPEGFNLLVWVAPIVAVAAGVVILGVLMRRWTRHAAAGGVPETAVDPAMRERIRREMDADDA